MFSKNAILQHKRLIAIFILTIVIPSLTLSLFGILSIGNEKYRREQQILSEQKQAMALLKSRLSGRVQQLENLLLRLTGSSVFHDRDYSAIHRLATDSLLAMGPVDQVFLVFEEAPSFFPQLQSAPVQPAAITQRLSVSHQVPLTLAWNAEFVRHDLNEAASMLNLLVQQATGDQDRALLLNHLARVQKKSGKYDAAVRTYKRIIQDHSATRTVDRLPLSLTAELQIVDCVQKSGRADQAREQALALYERILDGNWLLSETQFQMYAEMVRDSLANLFTAHGGSSRQDQWQRHFTKLQDLHRIRLQQWQVRRKIESDIIPELRKLVRSSRRSSLQFAKMVQEEAFLITAAFEQDWLCIKWNNNRLIDEWIKPIADSLLATELCATTIMDERGGIIWGNDRSPSDLYSINGEFDHYFPPWRIRLTRSGALTWLGSTWYKNYYFWSIVTMLMILIFGTFLIIRMLAREREIAEMKSEFLSSVSHELKTPLTSIKALIERLIDGKVSDPQKRHQYYSVIAQDTNKLTRLVENILDSSRIEADRKEYFFEPTDVTVWLNEVLDQCRKEYLYAPIEVQKDFHSPIPVIELDREAMAQCMSNLLDNAIKFSLKEKSVDVCLQQEDGDVLIRVRDRGIGIAQEDLLRIFDRFYQSSAWHRHSVKGAGLGLSLVKHTVEAHGGKVTVQSCLGQGSVFTISLPIEHLRQ